MKSTFRIIPLALLLSLVTACPGEIPDAPCTARNCANGCCTSQGTCVLSTATTCGISGAACQACSTGNVCRAGVCASPGTGGMPGSGGSGGTDDGGATDAGGEGIDSGSPDAGFEDGGFTDAGFTDAGFTDAGFTDAGSICQSTPHDALIGTLRTDGGLTIVDSFTLPSDVVAYAERADGLRFALRASGEIIQLEVANGQVTRQSVVSNALDVTDRDGGTVFLGGALTFSGNLLAASYTRSNQSGVVHRFDTVDGGASSISAPGVFTLAGEGNGLFAVNSLGLGPVTDGAGIYTLRADGSVGATRSISFDPAWQASSGFMANTGTIWLFGYFDGTDNKNYVRALTVQPGLLLIGNIQLSAGPVVASGSDILDVTATPSAAVIIHGDFAPITFAPYATRLERIGLSSSQGAAVVGTSTTIAQANDECTRVLFSGLGPTTWFLGIADKNGRRVVRFAP